MKSDMAISQKRPSLWYGWVILAVVFIVMSVMVGIRNSLGFFFKAIAGEFGWTRAQTAGAYSIGMLVQSICSPLFGSMGERWSLRWMMALGVFFGGAALLIGSSIGGLVSILPDVRPVEHRICGIHLCAPGADSLELVRQTARTGHGYRKLGTGICRSAESDGPLSHRPDRMAGELSCACRFHDGLDLSSVGFPAERSSP